MPDTSSDYKEHSFPGTPKKFFFEGRYRKLVRDLPQTTFFCPKCKGKRCDSCEGRGKLFDDSVQDLIARVAMPRFKARRHKFHGAGREDVDVRMLGNGRPFVFEMTKVKREAVDLQDLAEAVTKRSDGKIEIFNLNRCERNRIPYLKQANCDKEYSAKVQCENISEWSSVGDRLDDLIRNGPFVLSQKTPARVAHRRGANTIRERWLQLMDWQILNRGELALTLKSQHGTYIKEAISSDSGRTKNSISELLSMSCECVELDVINVMLD